MNTINVLNTQYLHSANRTIETISINNKVFYIYNHQGQYFRLFDQKEELGNYLDAKPYKMLCEFYSEEALDNYLLQASK